MQILPGSIVRSNAGRDQERYYVVLAREGSYALIADGKVHRAEHPKRKNIRHLSATAQIVPLTETGTNPKLRRALRRFNEPETAVTE